MHVALCNSRLQDLTSSLCIWVDAALLLILILFGSKIISYKHVIE